jgi:hypothetical protein
MCDYGGWCGYTYVCLILRVVGVYIMFYMNVSDVLLGQFRCARDSFSCVAVLEQLLRTPISDEMDHSVSTTSTRSMSALDQRYHSSAAALGVNRAKDRFLTLLHQAQSRRNHLPADLPKASSVSGAATASSVPNGSISAHNSPDDADCTEVLPRSRHAQPLLKPGRLRWNAEHLWSFPPSSSSGSDDEFEHDGA